MSGEGEDRDPGRSTGSPQRPGSHRLRATPSGHPRRSTEINVWRRRGGEEDVPFHRYCDVFPRRGAGDDGHTRHDDDWIFVTSGVARWTLRHTPLIVLMGLVLIGTAELLGASSLSLPILEGTRLEGLAIEIVLGLVWVILLLWLLHVVGLLPRSDLLQAFLIYATLLVLLGDVTYWFLRVTVAIQTGGLGQLGDGSLLPGSGYLLIMFIGGHLVYDGMLRTENTFSRLHEKDPPIVGPAGSAGSVDEGSSAFERARAAYEDNYLAEFKATLEHRIELGDWLRVDVDASIPTAYLFSVVFVLPFVWLRLPDVVGNAVLSLLGVVEVLVFFQFLVIIKFFNRLLTRHSPYDDAGTDGFTMLYQPHHPDGYAGFRDLGKFAVRVNTLLFFGGLYTAYWLYTSGVPNFPVGAGYVLSGEVLSWAFHFITPLVVYVLTVVVWLYASFWQIHKAMRKGRERRIRLELADSPDGDLPDDKRDLRQAPVWPLNVRMFVSIVVGDAIPILSLVPLLWP